MTLSVAATRCLPPTTYPDLWIPVSAVVAVDGSGSGLLLPAGVSTGSTSDAPGGLDRLDQRVVALASSLRGSRQARSARPCHLASVGPVELPVMPPVQPMLAKS